MPLRPPLKGQLPNLFDHEASFGRGFYSSPAGHSTAQRPSSRHLYICLSATTPARPTRQDRPLGLLSSASTHTVSPYMAQGCHLHTRHDIHIYIPLFASWPTFHCTTAAKSPVDFSHVSTSVSRAPQLMSPTAPRGSAVHCYSKELVPHNTP